MVGGRRGKGGDLAEGERSGRRLLRSRRRRPDGEHHPNGARSKAAIHPSSADVLPPCRSLALRGIGVGQGVGHERFSLGE
jgi:hypothetical protein